MAPRASGESCDANNPCANPLTCTSGICQKLTALSLVFAKGLSHEGVILARLHGLDPSDKATRVVTAVAGEGVNLRRAFTVMDGQGCRRRA